MKTKPTEVTVDQFNQNQAAFARKLRGLELVTYKNNLRLTKEQESVLVGTLLGDASIRIQKRNMNIKFEQNYTQLDYIQHLYQIFKPFVGTAPRMRIIKNSFHKNYGVSCWFATYAHTVFTHYENQFYRRNLQGKRQKIVPKNIHQMLTPQALAYWFMDDGSYVFTKWGTGYALNTQGFKHSEQIILFKALKRKFYLNFEIRRDKIYYRLVLQEHCEEHFKQLIGPYIVSSFQYKLDKKQIR